MLTACRVWCQDARTCARWWWCLVLQLWCQRWNVCRLTLSGDVWPRVRQQVRPYECGLHGEGCHASGPVLLVTCHEHPEEGRNGYTRKTCRGGGGVLVVRSRGIMPTRKTAYIIYMCCLHGCTRNTEDMGTTWCARNGCIHGLFGHIFTAYMPILQTIR